MLLTQLHLGGCGVSTRYDIAQNSAAPLRNQWAHSYCNFQISTAVIFNKISIVLMNVEHSKSTKSLDAGTDALSFLKSVKDAETARPEDKVMLLQRIESEIDNGCDGLDKAIRQKFVPLFVGQQLRAAAKLGAEDAMAELLKGASAVVIDSLHYNGSTALLFASQGNHTGCVIKLLAAGADPNIVDPGRCWSCLHSAAGESNMVQFQLKRVVSPWQRRNDLCPAASFS